MVVILLMIFLFTINPFTQIQKARDTQRRNDIHEIKNAVETYYHDHNCYPKGNIISWGSEWKENETIYMKKVPTGLTANIIEYIYLVDSNDCSQWYAIFTMKELTSQVGSSNSVDCGLDALGPSCLPQNYSNIYMCAYGGNIDCSTGLNNFTLNPTQIGPTATPTQAPCDQLKYVCRGPNNTQCHQADPDPGEKYWCGEQCPGGCPQ